MTNGKQISTPCTYRIRISGFLENTWSDWFYGFSIHHQAPGETILVGRVIDQSALYGILAKISELGYFLLSVDLLAYGDQTWQNKFERGQSCNPK